PGTVSVPGSGAGLPLGRERLAGLEHRLQVAEDERPSPDAGGGLGRALELVVHERQLARPAPGRLDLPGHPALVLDRQLVVVEAPHLLGRGPDVELVDLGGRLGHGGHAVSSRLVLRSSSADTSRARYLSIQRSWIWRIGTGFRKWSFSRPRLRETTSPAPSNTFRCFITPNRVIASCASSSVSVRPSRSNSRSSSIRLVGSASALKTRSSSMPPIIGDQMVTCQG